MNYTEFLESLDPEDLIDVYEYTMGMAMVSVLAEELNLKSAKPLKKQLMDTIFFQARKRMRLVHGSELLEAITNSYIEKGDKRVTLQRILNQLPKK